MRTRGRRWHKLATTAVVAAAATPTVLRWLTRSGAARRTIDMRTTLVVDRQVSDVFAFCRDFENFPRIVDSLVSVEDFQDGRSRWSVRSPDGHVIRWDATVTKYVPNAVIAWESVPGSEVHASGLMRFMPLPPDATRVDIAVTFRPLHTHLREALRALLHSSGSTRLHDELARASQELARR